jgi:hypothetical protein
MRNTFIDENGFHRMTVMWRPNSPYDPFKVSRKGEPIVLRQSARKTKGGINYETLSTESGKNFERAPVSDWILMPEESIPGRESMTEEELKEKRKILGRIEGLEEKGFPEADIWANVGALQHVEKRGHLEELYNYGYSNVLNALADILTNYTEILPGTTQNSLLLVKRSPDKNSPTLSVRLNFRDGVYQVASVFEGKDDFLKEKESIFKIARPKKEPPLTRGLPPSVTGPDSGLPQQRDRKDRAFPNLPAKPSGRASAGMVGQKSDSEESLATIGDLVKEQLAEQKQGKKYNQDAAPKKRTVASVRQELREYLAENPDAAAGINPEDLAALDKRTLDTMSLDELTALHGKVMKIRADGIRELEMKKAQRQERLDKVLETLYAAIGGRKGNPDAIINTQTDTRGKKESRWDKIRANTQIMSRLTDWLDGYKDYKGAWHKTFYEAATKAEDVFLRAKNARMEHMRSVRAPPFHAFFTGNKV